MKTINLYPETIIYNSTVHTVDMKDSVVQAVAILGEKIMATGDNAEILGLAGPNTVKIDAKGKSLIPGINDSHTHMWEAGMLMDGLITFGYESIGDLALAVGRFAEHLKPGEWLQGGCWLESQFQEERMPTRWDLDPHSKANPVVLERIFSTCCLNSLALKAAGIDRNTPDPIGGTIGRDANGEPNGLLFRSAKQLVRNVMPGAFGEKSFGTGDGIRLAIKRGMNDYLRYGITSIIEAGLMPSMVHAYQLIKDSGELNIRVNTMLSWHGFTINEDKAYSDRLINELGLYDGFGDEWMRIGALKMAIDGGLTSRTALRSWNYVGESEIKPVELRLALDKLDGWVKEAHDRGWGVGIHVMGDLAVGHAVDAIYNAYKENPADRRHQLIHCYYPTSDMLPKMAEAGMIVAAQPAFIYNEADGYDKLLTPDKQREFMPLRSCLDAGVPVSISSDMPSAHHNPFWNMYSAVTRKGMRGHCLGEEECITVNEALRAMTKTGAYMTFEDKMKGSIEPGMLADMVLIDHDLENTSVEELRNISVQFTMVGGRFVYLADRFNIDE